MVHCWRVSNPVVWIGSIAEFGGDGINESLSKVIVKNSWLFSQEVRNEEVNLSVPVLVPHALSLVVESHCIVY